MQRRTFLAAIFVSGVLASPLHGAFRYADGVTTTGGQFNNSASYSPANLVNNGFTSPINTIDTTVTYPAAGNNYATANGTAANFNLTFNFNSAENLSAMYVWNYVYRTAGGSGTATPGVNAYTLTFYSDPNGMGSVIGSFSGNLAMAVYNAVIPAQTINFGTTNVAVRSVVMQVTSNHGASFAGMNELAFESAGAIATPIIAFSASTNLVTYGSTVTLNWQVDSVTNLVIDNGVGSVLDRTTNGMGSIPLVPTNGSVTYTLTANGVSSRTVSLIGLPPKEKVHLYLLMGQSNMEGAGTPYDAVLDAPQSRVLQFGSRDGMESLWLQASHPLTSLTAGASQIGPGLEFAKTMLASNADPDVVIGLINHAKGTTAIQWWAPGVMDNKQINPATGLNYYLYDEAVRRATNAAAYGVIKGVLWHQGEYNSNSGNSNPSPEPDLYAPRVQTLVDNLRRDLGRPGLPFICGQLVPTWTNSFGTVFSSGLAYRVTVEAALGDLPNQRFNTACVDNVGLIGREDQAIHFDAASQRELGRRYAEQLLLINQAAALSPQLVVALAGNQLQLSWPATHTGWSLQAQTNALTAGLSANWSTVAGSTLTNQMSLPLGNSPGSVFFRLQSP
jgi:hypothetical protein